MGDSAALAARRVRHALGSIARAPFLPEGSRRYAGDDRALSIGYGQTNSQPRTVQALLEALDVRPGHRVLDVGCGSGWTCALLAALAGAEGEVVGVELVPQLADRARRLLSDCPQVRVLTADPDVLGVPQSAPYDRILVSAEARAVPGPLVGQLADGGRMVLPVHGRLVLVRRDGDRYPQDTLPGRYAFVPLLWSDDGT